jgi:hypothetical protein
VQDEKYQYSENLRGVLLLPLQILLHLVEALLEFCLPLDFPCGRVLLVRH